MSKILEDKIEIKIRFNEIDSMNVVWHGNYVKYMEDGRESFGEKYGLHYLDFMKNEIVAPIVYVEMEYKKFLRYGEKAIVETKYVDCEAAKLKFEYTIYRSCNNEVVATGKSMQVFLNTEGELLLTIPPFFYEWKKKWGFIK
ncbi:MAG: acyl-CoA thioesterase [Bacteroidales bacterium]|nr:acyl-CoA thioesterase [Bacteroidales bacterium]